MPTEDVVGAIKAKVAGFWARCVDGKRGRPLLLPKVNAYTQRTPETATDTAAVDRAMAKRAVRRARNLSLRAVR